MKIFFGGLIALVLAVVSFSVNDAAALNTNNFRISSFDIGYNLSRDSDGRSILKTTETITAEFPDYDQNHGLERALPTQYDGHSLGLDITSVTDENGTPLKFSANTEYDMLTLRIGDADRYVHGTQIYKISYTQHDVTKFFANTDSDEWYWDTNGTQWKVLIEQLTISIEIDKSLVSSLTGQPFCYSGLSGSTNRCVLDSPSDSSFSTHATDLTAGQNVTVSFGFKEGTFAAYQPTVLERFMSIWWVVFWITVLLAIILFIVLSVIYERRRNRTREINIIVTEYIPPKGISVTVSSQVAVKAVATFSAQLIDLAVRHFIEIIETKPKSVWKAAEYDIKVITDPAGLLEEEQEILADMFGYAPGVGDRLPLKQLQHSTSYASRTADNDKKLTKLIEGNYAIREKSAKVSKYFYRWAVALLILGVLTLSPPLLFVAGVVALFGVTIRPLTDKGLELRRYLLGLDKYIKAAEAERLKFLQGPETVQKIGESVDVDNPGQLVKLYERVLPYAILFGREKEWGKQLGKYYETAQTSPDWYTGNAVFNAVVFSSALNSFSSAAAYSGGSSSSSSGGSSGGGSSGGGGGGGGGGGW